MHAVKLNIFGMFYSFVKTKQKFRMKIAKHKCIYRNKHEIKITTAL